MKCVRWTNTERRIIRVIVLRFGGRVKDIARHLPHRTCRAIHNQCLALGIFQRENSR